MARSAIAFLAGLGTGYLNQTEKEKDRDRQAKIDQITFDNADRATEQYNTAKKDKANLAAAFKPATVNDQTATLDTSGAPVLYQNSDVAQSDYRQARMLAEDGTPDAAPATINAPKPSFAAAGIPYTDKASAQAGADAYNKPEAQNQRVINALGGVDPLKAMDLDHQQVQRGRETTKFTQEQTAYGKKLGDEGVFDGLKALRNGDGAGMKTEFNKSGQYKIDGEPVVTPEQRTVPGLGDIKTYNATFNVVGPDGKTTSKTINSHDTSMSLMPYEKQMELGIKGGEADSKSAYQASQGIYYQKVGDAAGVRAENSGGGGGNGVDRIPEIDKLALGSINKEREKLGADLTKAQSDPMYDATKPSAAVKSINMRMGTLQMQSDAIIARNSGGAAPGSADPLGQRKPAPPSGDATDAAPIRNNNPGALMPGGKLAQYKTPEEGLAALDGNLKKYGQGGVNTIAGVISKWAPPNENDTKGYIAAVARRLNMSPDQKIDLSNPITRHVLSAAITVQENGNRTVFKPGTGAAPAGATKVAGIEGLNQQWEKAHVSLNAATTPEEKASALEDITALKQDFSNMNRQPPYATPAKLLGVAPAPSTPAVTAQPVRAAQAQDSSQSASRARSKSAPPTTASAVATNIANIIGTGSAGAPKMTTEQAAQVTAQLEYLKKINGNQD